MPSLYRDMRPAHPVYYHGVRYRSRSEAKWAVVFTQLGIPYIYEPQLFRLPAGNYRPDFYLTEMRCYAEVKPCNLQDRRHSQLGQLTGKPLYLLSGDMPQLPYTDDRRQLAYALAHRIWRKWPLEAGRSFALVREGSGRYGFAPLRARMLCDPFDPAILTAYIAASSYHFERG